MAEDKRPTTINTLLDVERFTGENTGRMFPILLFLVVSGLPGIIYVYALIPVISFWLYILFEIVWSTIWGLVIIGEQSKKVDQFKRQLYDIYSSVYKLMRIKTIHEDGCIEYINNTVAYVVTASNGSSIDQLVRARIVSRFLTQLGSEYVPDIYIQNVSSDEELANRYAGVKLFNDNDVAKDFIDIIDYNRKFVTTNSLIVRIIFVIKARRSEWKDLQKSVASALSSDDARIFKTLQLADKASVEKIISRDINAYVDFEEMNRMKYNTGTYFGSKVIGYDLEKNSVDEESSEERGFMVDG